MTESNRKNYFKSIKSFPTKIRKSFLNKSQVSDSNTVPQETKKDDSFQKDSINIDEKENNSYKLVVPTTSKQIDIADQGPHLVYTTSYGSSKYYPIKNAETTIGRKEDNDIVLIDGTISKFHAVVYSSDTGVSIMDKNSSNGVMVNEQTIKPGFIMQLRNGDCITIGVIKLMYYESFAKIPHQETHSKQEILSMVTILPTAQDYDDKVVVESELMEFNFDFKKAALVSDTNLLREDYEKLRIAYELSKVTLTNDLATHLEKALDLIFEILPVDRGVVLLVDHNTGTLATHHVKLRSTIEMNQEIILSSTVLTRVFETRKCLVIGDTRKDEELSGVKSILNASVRSVICLPLMGHNKVLGLLHLDAVDSITTFSAKDLAIINTIANQTAIAIENSILMVEYEQNTKVKEHLSRFLAPHIVEKMSNPSEIMKKGGQHKIGTIIFADIRGFTNLSEKCSPTEVVLLLNDYFERLVKIVFKYNGIVDKYIGDALMAVFGTLENENSAEIRAVMAAFEFKYEIQELNENRARFGQEPISIGIGVNTGDLLAGFIGSSQRLEYTVIGDSVNTSSRICSMSNHNQVLISEFTYEYVKPYIDVVKVGARQFKGKNKEVVVYEVIAIHDDIDLFVLDAEDSEMNKNQLPLSDDLSNSNLILQNISM